MKIVILTAKGVSKHAAVADRSRHASPGRRSRPLGRRPAVQPHAAAQAGVERQIETVVRRRAVRIRDEIGTNRTIGEGQIARALSDGEWEA